MAHSSSFTDNSSQYSTVPSTTSICSDDYNTKEEYQFPKREPVSNYQVINPYANSLWYNARGESGSQTIDEIRQRAVKSKRKLEDEVQPNLPPRYDSLATKKVDSPIANEEFFNNDSKWPDPNTKGSAHLSKDSRYRRVFKELIDTEQKYASDLKLTQSIYRSLLSARRFKHIISETQESTIFSNIDTLIELSELFLKDVTRKARSDYPAGLKVDLFEHFDFCNVENIDIGDALTNLFNRFRISYTSYARNHTIQLKTLSDCQKTGGPKVIKWLDECSYLAQPKSDCWNLESLLIKPVQRIAKYPLLIDSLLDAVNSEVSVEIVEHLYEAKRTLEQILNSIENDEPSSEVNDLPKFPQEKVHKVDYTALVKEFKTYEKNLQLFKKEVELSLKPLLKVMLFNQELARKWKQFMDYEEVESPSEAHYIKSIYSSYLERVTKQVESVKLIQNEFREKIIKAIDIILEYCLPAKQKINKHSSYKGAYMHYIKYGKKSANHTVSHSLEDAQQYVIIENEIKDELPLMLEKMKQLQHNLSLLYTSLTLKWFETVAGTNQLEQYQELLSSGELAIGDNFDIIELYSLSKHNTSQALKDMCVRSPPGLGTDTSVQLRISASTTVRHLFGV